MNKIREIIQEIANTNSRNLKEEIVRKHKDDELFQYILKFVYDTTSIKTGVKRKKLEKVVKVKPTQQFSDFFDLSQYIINNNTGSDIVIANIQNFLSTQTPEMVELYTQIILQDLKCGLQSSTINSAFGYEYIYEHKMEKGETAKPRHLEWLKGKKFGIYKKIDGYRAEIVIDNNKITVYSSGGEIQTGWNEIEEVLSNSNLPNGTFACETLACDPGNSMTRMERFNKTGSILRKDGTKKGIEIHVFNFIPDDGFFKGFHPTSCEERKALAKSLVKQVNSPLVQYIEPFYVGDDMSQIDYWFEKMVSQDDEGIMVLPMDSLYNGKKSYQQMLKIKTEHESDLMIIGFEQGEKGKEFENTLGTIIVDYKGTRVKVMAGYKTKYDSKKYDDRMVRDYIWSHQDELMGKIIQVKYMDETTNKEGTTDLRLARIICWRDDKTEASYN